MTALHWAAYHDRPEHVQLLISKSANMFAPDCDGKTPLHWASQVCHITAMFAFLFLLPFSLFVLFFININAILQVLAISV